MTPIRTAFTDAATTAGLYRDSRRLAARTSALHSAKTAGRPVADVIAELAARHLTTPQTALITDIGCGRGTTSRVLTEQLRPRRLLAIDASPAMLAAARARAARHALIAFVQADFRELPLRDASCDLAVAAFCLYHAPDPRLAVAEIARVLTPDGTAILVTKSANSYRALDELVAAAGLDPIATKRPSLYAAAHSGNLATLTTPFLHVRQVQHEVHRFTFTGADHLADYLATSPKYDLPPGLLGNPGAIATALRAARADEQLETTSTVTYLIATGR
ncbi:class I SAM-dependent methyltransferase [Sphaerisporangium sp. B11E5]|uniref:class I SAM-dependent methyltransferase n=1 Tax=Sphaerisporangium sp. B11E5 TaxID=3153563 RepID=UPI00325C5385